MTHIVDTNSAFHILPSLSCIWPTYLTQIPHSVFCQMSLIYDSHIWVVFRIPRFAEFLMSMTQITDPYSTFHRASPCYDLDNWPTFHRASPWREPPMWPTFPIPHLPGLSCIWPTDLIPIPHSAFCQISPMHAPHTWAIFRIPCSLLISPEFYQRWLSHIPCFAKFSSSYDPHIHWYKLIVRFSILYKSDTWIKTKQFSPWIWPMLPTQRKETANQLIKPIYLTHISHSTSSLVSPSYNPHMWPTFWSILHTQRGPGSNHHPCIYHTALSNPIWRHMTQFLRKAKAHVSLSYSLYVSSLHRTRYVTWPTSRPRHRPTSSNAVNHSLRIPIS